VVVWVEVWKHELRVAALRTVQGDHDWRKAIRWPFTRKDGGNFHLFRSGIRVIVLTRVYWHG
jgi:hypothetical protein